MRAASATATTSTGLRASSRSSQSGAGSVGAALHAGEGRIAVGVDISATHHRAVRDGYVVGVATPLHRGRSAATFEIVISTESGKRVCTSRLTCMIRDSVPGA